MPNHALRVASLVCSLLAASDALAAKTAFRLTDLDLRDPHIYVTNVGFCLDITDLLQPNFTSTFNGALQSRIQTDGNADGALDLNLLLIFDPVDPSAPGGTLTFGEAICTAPIAGTSCTPNPIITPTSVTYLNQSSGPPCLLVISGSTYPPYSPEISLPSPPYFKTVETNITLRVFGNVNIPFSHVRIAARYVGSPTANLNTGVIRGFLSQEDADAIVVPLPTVGNQLLSSVLPNATLICPAHTDQDSLRTVDGCLSETGWWFYWNFTAVAVPFTELPTGIETPEASGLWLDDAIPNPFNPSATIRYSISSQGFVRVSVFDAGGRFVADLVREDQALGEHAARWDGTSASGEPVSSGVYFVRLESAGQTRSRKIVLLK